MTFFQESKKVSFGDLKWGIFREKLLKSHENMVTLFSNTEKIYILNNRILKNYLWTTKKPPITRRFNRGWENRTPAKSFGDFCHTIWPIPSIYLQNCTYVTSLLPSALSTVSLIRGHSKPSAFSCLLLRKCLSQFPQAPGCKHPTPSLIVPAALKLFGQTLDRLVTVSSIHYCTSTSALSTSSSSRGLTSFEWDISSWGGLHA